MDPDDLATILSFGLYPLDARIPRQIGAGLCSADYVLLVGTLWWVGSELGELLLRSCMPLPIVFPIEGIRTSEDARTRHF